MTKLEKFVKLQYSYACNAKTYEEFNAFFHNAFGAVQWEGSRTGEDLTEWWDEWREKFIKEWKRM